jgi:hypothetical protein
MGIVTCVWALHTFEPTEQGELAFEKGDIINVVNHGYKDWWCSQLKGTIGIFLVNYVIRFNFPSSFMSFINLCNVVGSNAGAYYYYYVYKHCHPHAGTPYFQTHRAGQAHVQEGRYY